MRKAKEAVEAAVGCPEEEKKAAAALDDIHNRFIAFFKKHRSLKCEEARSWRLQFGKYNLRWSASVFGVAQLRWSIGFPE